MTEFDASLPVTIDGNRFDIDIEKFSWSPIASLRQATDQAAEPGEQSLLPSSLWKRTRGNFKIGAGQDYADEPGDSDELRFSASRGIDPWDQRKLELLADTQLKRATSTTSGKLIPVDDRVYWLDGGTIRHDTTPGGSGGFSSTVTGSGYVDINQYGNKIVACDGSNTWTISDGTRSALGTDPCDMLVYGNGRLIAGHDNELFEIDGAGVKATMWSHPNTDFAWKGGVAAPNGIYVYGTAGATSEIYFVGIDDASTALFAPFTAAPLTPNEEVFCLYHYGGTIVIGTSRGFRLANIAGSGHLSYGPLIAVGAVRAFAGDGEDLWFTWTNFDASYTGLGRSRLDKGSDILVPRYATDVMAATQGTVLGTCSYGDQRYFMVSGVGLYGTTTDKVATGWYNSGWVTYGTPELKELHSLDVRHEPLPAGSSVVGKIVKEDSSESTIVTSSVTAAVGLASSVSPRLALEQAQVRIELARGTDTTTTPEFRRWTLRAVPLPYKQSAFVLPLRVVSQVSGPRGQAIRNNALTVWNLIRGLETAREVITVTIGDFSVEARIDGIGFNPGDAIGWSRAQQFLEGTMMVRFETAQPLGS